MKLSDMTFTIYGKENCPHCIRAKEVAKANNLEYIYLTLGQNYTKEELVKACSPVIPTTVPRVFYETDDGVKYIGTCDDFVAFVNLNK